jgi:hypothetical protein
MGGGQPKAPKRVGGSVRAVTVPGCQPGPSPHCPGGHCAWGSGRAVAVACDGACAGAPIGRYAWPRNA